MHKYQHYHFLEFQLYYKKFLGNKYNELVTADSLRSIALSMISLFIPIYLYELGISVRIIALYLALMLIFNYLAHLVLVRSLFFRLGVKKVLIVSYVFNIFFYIILYGGRNLMGYITEPGFLALIGIIFAVTDTFYWIGHHVFFVCSTELKGNGKKVGLLSALPALFGIIGPLLGGFFITDFGFRFVFLISTIILFFASVVLLFSANVDIPRPKIDMRTILDAKNPAKNSIYIMQGVGFSGLDLAWPLIMFFSAISFVGIGLVNLLSAFANSLFCYLAGRQADKNGNRGVAKLGVIGHGLTMIGRSFITTVIGAGLWQTFAGVFGGLHYIPIETGFYERAHRDVYNAVLNREFYLHIGRVSLYLLLFLLLTIMPAGISLRLGLFSAGLATMAIIIFIDQDKSIIK